MDVLRSKRRERQVANENLYRSSNLNTFIAVLLLSAAVVHAQAGFGATSQSGAWQAGQSQHASSSLSSNASNGGSSWTAGKASFGSQTQRGGLWQETSGNDNPLPSSHPPAKGTGSFPETVTHTTTLTSKLSTSAGSKMATHSMSQSSHGAPATRFRSSSGKNATKSKSGSKSSTMSFQSSSGKQSKVSSNTERSDSSSPREIF